MDGSGKKKDSDIWMMERRADGWGEPVNPGTSVNSAQEERSASAARNGNLYFASGYDIYRCVFRDGRYMPREKLGEGINTEYYELACLIAPDESFLLFSSTRPDLSEENIRIYVSFHNKDDSWTKPINLNDLMNFDKPSRFPCLTPNEKFIIFQSGNDYYWVSRRILDECR